MVESYLVVATLEDFSDKQTMFADRINADTAYRIYRDCVDVIDVYIMDNRTGEILIENKKENYDNCLSFRLASIA